MITYFYNYYILFIYHLMFKLLSSNSMGVYRYDLFKGYDLLKVPGNIPLIVPLDFLLASLSTE